MGLIAFVFLKFCICLFFLTLKWHKVFIILICSRYIMVFIDNSSEWKVPYCFAA